MSDSTEGAGVAGTLADRTARAGGAGARAAAVRGQRGSQALEFAMVMPALVLLLVLLVHTGLLGVDLVVAHGAAREAARAAALGDDDTVRDAVVAALGSRAVDVRLDPPDPRSSGELVTARLRVRSRAFATLGAEVWLPARATMRVEGP